MKCEAEHQQHRPLAGLGELPRPAAALAPFLNIKLVSGIYREGLDLKAVL